MHKKLLLTESDREVINTLKALNVFQKIDSALIPAEEEVVKIQCPDGDQMVDHFDHEREWIEKRGGFFRPHMPSLHGGAMLIAEDCPAYREFRVDELLLLHIREAERMKYIHTVVLNIHVLCGKACELGLSLVQQMLFLMRAKVRVRAVNPTNKVICFLFRKNRGQIRLRAFFIKSP